MEDDGLRFKRADGEKKSAYTFSLEEICNDLEEYEKFVTHKFIVTTTEREIIKHWKNSILNYKDSIDRMVTTMNRFSKETLESDLVTSHKETYPEDWI